jgi:hypothetical protein
MNVVTINKHMEDFCVKFSKLKIIFKDETKSVSFYEYLDDLKK